MINLVLAKAHQEQISSNDVKAEIDGISSILNTMNNFINNSINFVLCGGNYNHNNRTMNIGCVFVNKYSETINELHGVVRLRFKNENALIAKITIDFDENFMGEIKKDSALLVHFNVPVKGLDEDKSFKPSEIECLFDDVRATKVTE